MANWKTYMNSDFAGCRLLAYAHDLCRNRDVRLYLIPGEWDAVGVTDGVDRWIAPAVRDIMSVDIPDLLKRLQAGETLPKPEPFTLPRRKRESLAPDEEPQPRKRTRVAVEDEPQPRRSRVQLV